MSLTGFLSYSRVNWQQSPSKSTPLSAANLNVMDAGIKNNNDMISNIRDEITQLNSNIINDTCTNLFKPTLQTCTINGITCTNNGDGTYKIKGTNNTSTQFSFLLGSVEIINSKQYKLVGCPSGQSMDTSHMFLHNENWSFTLNDIGDGDSGKPPIGVYDIRIEVKPNESVNLDYKPMLTTDLKATYNNFISYTGVKGRLNADVASLLNNIINTNISTQSSSDEVKFYFSNNVNGLYLVIAIDLDDLSNTDNRGLIAIMDVRNNTSYRHVLQSNTITLPGHSNVIILLKGATNYLCSSIRLVTY